MGAQTVEGIEIVNVAGTSDGTFEKESRIVAGAYDYDVVRRGSNWYLSSAMEPADPTDPVDQTEPNGPSDPGVPASPETPQTPVHPGGPSQIRPEFGSYLANDLAELKVGVEGQLTSRLTVWGNVSGQMGSDSYRNAQGMVGVKYNW
ncbi:TPA: autotransporter outer membrane beta-barrel domain-containing protein [Citrobacter farmeri]|nr:autotransporter outer membrane beta-barrel domain-containing protein [Citrobacter farmeri]EHK0946688.1 autotransporter outer membrane beta-barrel domain-containing protein [Citrobacter farmeri]EKX4541981.1 autotransporter outer membrane beta-barrel domain-containing protein [Citrobacter farmeri]MBJ9133336.1 autotransporter outer membrane beta-barrel domain-containing protein [Citrobacter farmeri]GJL45338.1 hypothetical protein TUM17580_13970 [Citrobacter farmeri]HBC0355546.1 autotransporter